MFIFLLLALYWALAGQSPNPPLWAAASSDNDDVFRLFMLQLNARLLNLGVLLASIGFTLGSIGIGTAIG